MLKESRRLYGGTSSNSCCSLGKPCQDPPPHLTALNATCSNLDIRRRISTSTGHQFVIETQERFLTESPVRKFANLHAVVARDCCALEEDLHDRAPPYFVVCLFWSLRFKIFCIEVKISSTVLYQDHHSSQVHIGTVSRCKPLKSFPWSRPQDRQVKTLRSAILGRISDRGCLTRLLWGLLGRTWQAVAEFDRL